MPGLPREREAEMQHEGATRLARPVVRSIFEETPVRGKFKIGLADHREAQAERAGERGETTRSINMTTPRSNQPGVEMIHLESCLSEISNCHNALIKTPDYERAIIDWARDQDISERLRGLVRDSRIRFHNMLRISVSGCPNGCSRPQIADMGITGFVTPAFDPAGCASCGACAETCPDEAIFYEGRLPWFDLRKCLGCKKCSFASPNDCITLSEPRVRLTAGGRLGRRPRLAEVIGEAGSPREVVQLIDRIVGDYIDNAEPGERFADYWKRKGKERFNG